MLAAFTITARALDDQPGTKSEEQQAIGRLIQQLGEASFEVRENAARQLAEIGSAAMTELVSETNNPDPEIQHRCRQIIIQIEARNFERRLEEFLAENGESDDHQLPGWTRFKRSYGSDRIARELFVSMLRAEPELIQKLEENQVEAASLLNDRITEFRQQMRFQQLELPSLASVLFVAGEDDVEVEVAAARLVTSFCYQPSFREGMAKGSDTRAILQKIIERWVSQDNPIVAQQGVMLCMQFDLPVGVEIAKRILQDSKGAKHMHLYAFLAMAKLGDKDDQELQSFLASKLDDETLLSKRKLNNQTMQTEVRDVALAALLHLQEQDLKQFGFTNIQKQAVYLYAPHTLGFENDEKRAVALEKWKDFSEKAAD